MPDLHRHTRPGRRQSGPVRYPCRVRGLPPLIEVAFIPADPEPPRWTLETLDADERRRYDRLHAIGRPLFLAAHAGARLLAARRAGRFGADTPSPGEYGWATLPSGKPSLTLSGDRPQPLHVNVAHGGRLAVVGVCDHGPIGVDVEHVDPRRQQLAIARRFFAAEEHAALAACGDDERTLRFHQWWTRKEAVLKTTGAGLRGGLTVRVDGPTDADGWRRVDLDGHPAPIFVRDLRTPDPFVFGAVAIEGHPGVVEVVDVRFEDQSWIPRRSSAAPIPSPR